MIYSSEETAVLLLEIVPRVMHDIRREMRATKPANLTVTRFRALLFLRRNPEAGTSLLAEHLGISAPAVSRLVDALVKDSLVERRDPEEDRRRISLLVSEKGLAELKKAMQGTKRRLGNLFSGLGLSGRKKICLGLEELKNIFSESSEDAKE